MTTTRLSFSVLFVFTIGLLFLANSAVATRTDVGVITWNIADGKDADSFKVPIVNALNEILTKKQTTKFIALMLQESKLDDSERAKVFSWFNLAGFNHAGMIKSCDWFIHGCNELHLFAKKNHNGFHVATKTLSGSSEKSSVALQIQFVETTLKTICFVSSHFPPSSKTGGSGERLNSLLGAVAASEAAGLKKSFRLFSTTRKHFEPCDVTILGGDHNYRTADWGSFKNAVFNDQFEAIRKYYKHTSFPQDGIVLSHESLLEFPLIDDFEINKWDRNFREAELKYTHVPSIPPTFQPIKSKNCPNGLRTGHVYEPDEIEEKSPICFPTSSGGNCPSNNPSHWCVSITRPLSWTDVLLYRQRKGSMMKATLKLYGGVYLPTPSDHVPVLGIFEVLALGKGVQPDLPTIDENFVDEDEILEEELD